MGKKKRQGEQEALPERPPVETAAAGKCLGKKRLLDENSGGCSGDSPSPSGVLMFDHKFDTNNIRLTQRLEFLKYAYVDEERIVDDFEGMKNRADNKVVFWDTETKEFVAFSSSSRWAKDASRYEQKVKRKLREQTKGLRKLSMVTVNFDKKRIREILPDWWLDGSDEGIEKFLLIFGSTLLGWFLDALRKNMERRGLKWSFIGWAEEMFNKAGKFHLHYHILFYGGYVAPLNDLKRYWPYSDPNQVDVKVMRNNDVANYIVKYVGKNLGKLCVEGFEAHAAYVWFFRKRMYQVRLRGKDGKPHDCGIWKKRNLVYAGFTDEYGKRKILPRFRIEYGYTEKDDFGLEREEIKAAQEEARKWKKLELSLLRSEPPSDMFLDWKWLHDAESIKALDS